MINFLKAAVQFVTRRGGQRRNADTITAFFYEGSDTSFVAAGKTETLVERDGWIIEPIVSREGQVISFIVDNLKTMAYWNLEVAAPQGAIISKGSFKGATRYPFQEADEPGLAFSGCHRANNELTGEFTVLEAVVRGSRVISFAADFVQYDECREASWNRGSVRYKSHVPLGIAPKSSKVLPV
jgi:hypothetical protein